MADQSTPGGLIPPGVRYMLGAAFFFSVMSLLVKVAGERLPSQEIVLARGVVNLVLTYGLVRSVGVSPWGNRRPVLAARGLFGFAALSCFFYALTHLPIAEATVLQYTSPIWTALIAAPLLGEAITSLVMGSSAVSFGGVALIARPGFLFEGMTAGLDLLAVGVALTGALMSGAAYVAVRKASRTEHPFVIVFWFALITTVGSVPFAATDFVWPSGWEWLTLLGVGVATQIAQVYLTRGLGLEPAGRAMAIGYTQIVFAAGWGAVFFAEYPDLLSIVGSVLVIAGTLAVGLRARISASGSGDAPASTRDAVER